jgi:tight adherence protein C
VSYFYSILFGTLIFFVFSAIALIFGQRQRLLQRRLQQVTAYSREKLVSEEHISAAQRLIGPAWDKFSFALANLAPVRLRRQIAEKLVEAGNPHGLRFDGFIGMLALGSLICGATAAGICLLLAVSFVNMLLIVCIGFLLGFVLPLWQLHKWIAVHKKQILRQLPEALDILTISVEAGLSFDAALAKLIEKSHGPLIVEFGRMLKEISMGKARAEAINDLGKRKRIDDLTFFTTALAHSDKLGVPIASILRVQSDEIRRRHRQRIEFEAMQTPIKMIFPLALCIFPALMIVLLAPAALMIMNSFMFQ